MTSLVANQTQLTAILTAVARWNPRFTVQKSDKEALGKSVASLSEKISKLQGDLLTQFAEVHKKLAQVASKLSADWADEKSEAESVKTSLVGISDRICEIARQARLRESGGSSSKETGARVAAAAATSAPATTSSSSSSRQPYASGATAAAAAAATSNPASTRPSHAARRDDDLDPTIINPEDLRAQERLFAQFAALRMQGNEDPRQKDFELEGAFDSLVAPYPEQARNIALNRSDKEITKGMLFTIVKTMIARGRVDEIAKLLEPIVTREWSDRFLLDIVDLLIEKAHFEEAGKVGLLIQNSELNERVSTMIAEALTLREAAVAKKEQEQAEMIKKLSSIGIPLAKAKALLLAIQTIREIGMELPNYTLVQPQQEVAMKFFQGELASLLNDFCRPAPE